MQVAALKRYCAGLTGAGATLHGPPANILVYAVGGKRFAHFKTSAPQRWRFSIKAPAGRFLELTDQPGIQPARWLGRFGWITIVDVRAMPAATLRALVDDSWRSAVAKLPKSRRPVPGPLDDGARAPSRRRPRGARQD
jgi:predicted DNA-binding protein (MmcQ/YjbR family)